MAGGGGQGFSEFWKVFGDRDCRILKNPSIPGVLRFRKTYRSTLSQGFLRVMLKGDDSLKGIAERFRMFLLLEGERNWERWFLKVLKEILKMLIGLLFKVLKGGSSGEVLMKCWRAASKIKVLKEGSRRIGMGPSK
jgi:hypothetical protein